MNDYVVTAVIRIAEADSREDAVSRAYLLLENAVVATRRDPCAEVNIHDIVEVIDVERAEVTEVQHGL